MHSVGQVDVPGARRKECFVAGTAPMQVPMGRGVVITEIGLGFHDASGRELTARGRDNHHSQQLACNDVRWSLEKRDGQRGCPSDLTHSALFLLLARGRLGAAGSLEGVPASGSGGAAGSLDTAGAARFRGGRRVRGLTSGPSGSAGAGSLAAASGWAAGSI